jgi:hypothetical protein
MTDEERFWKLIEENAKAAKERAGKPDPPPRKLPPIRLPEKFTVSS